MEFKISGKWDFSLREADQKKGIEEEKEEDSGKWELIINLSLSHRPLTSALRISSMAPRAFFSGFSCYLIEGPLFLNILHFLNSGKINIHNICILPICKCTVVQSTFTLLGTDHHHPSPKIFSCCKTGTLSPHTIAPRSSCSLVPGNHRSILSLLFLYSLFHLCSNLHYFLPSARFGFSWFFF